MKIMTSSHWMQEVQLLMFDESFFLLLSCDDDAAVHAVASTAVRC
jgi:hypothetical protein